ncbi:hypothetical protein BH11MYX1_BH11MYX1_48030 [soil metagenome]
MKRALLPGAVLLACKHDLEAGQRFSDAVQVICDAPAEADASYWKANLENTEAIELFETMRNFRPPDRQKRLAAALAKATSRAVDGSIRCHFGTHRS